ncbi:MAG TPA: ferredoxin reductase family protein [Candidatus Saccharimonadia bacterium]
MNPRTFPLGRQLWYWLYAAGIVIIAAFWWHASGHDTHAALYSVELAVGNLTGLIGTYQILWQVVLLSRLPVLENTIGMEKLTWLHKWNGYSALILIILHAVFLTLGYAILNHFNILAQLSDFMLNWNDVLKATIATLLLIGIVFISIGIVRRGLKYETWYYVHLFTYLAILLAFSHQLSVGSDFVGQRLFEAFWLSLYVLAFGAIGFFRFLWPVYLVYKHQFRVEKIVHETPDMLSVYVSGRHLEQLVYQPGQFIIWRFLTPELWWQAHPFSISTAPNGRYLRFTSKQVGDFTRSLSGLKPGALVSIDGPHGHFTPARLTRPKALLIAGGSGITPIRSMLEQLPAGIQDVVVLYAVRTRADLALRDEIEALAARRGAVVHYLLSGETVAGFTTGVVDQANLRALVPDVSSREVMLCGPAPMMDAVTANLEHLGLARNFIHTERFAY